MTRGLWTSLFALVAVAGIAAASPNIQPDTISPFGSQVFTVSWLQSPVPNPSQASAWNPIQSCNQVAAPTLLFADDPETWTTSGLKSWTYKNPGQPQVTVNNLLFEKGALDSSTPGLVYFYFQNSLGVTARLYIGGISNQSGSTTFKYEVKEHAGGSGTRASVRDGAMETKDFLTDFIPGTGLKSGSVNSGTTPTVIKTFSVNNGQIVQGEMSVTSLSGPATFYVYADDCSGTPCPSISNVNDNGDGSHRRGNFQNAEYVLHHDLTNAIETSGGFAWYDVVGPSSCVGAINGVDPFGVYTPRNSGDYGVPIVIYGTPGRTQFWFLMGSPAAGGTGTQDAFAVYVQGLNDPATMVDVTGAWALAFPTSAPPTPSPQPTATPLICCAQSAVLGLDNPSTQRTITWIPSGGEVLPARFWYNVPAFNQLGKAAVGRYR